MKKLRIILVSFLICVFFCGCAKKQANQTPQETLQLAIQNNVHYKIVEAPMDGTKGDGIVEITVPNLEVVIANISEEIDIESGSIDDVYSTITKHLGDESIVLTESVPLVRNSSGWTLANDDCIERGIMNEIDIFITDALLASSSDSLDLPTDLGRFMQ